jgi:hypothetical protein
VLPSPLTLCPVPQDSWISAISSFPRASFQRRTAVAGLLWCKLISMNCVVEFTSFCLLCSYRGRACFHPLPYLGILNHGWGTFEIHKDLSIGPWSHGVPDSLREIDLPVSILSSNVGLLGTFVRASLDLGSVTYPTCCKPLVLLWSFLALLNLAFLGNWVFAR